MFLLAVVGKHNQGILVASRVMLVLQTTLWAAAVFLAAGTTCTAQSTVYCGMDNVRFSNLPLGGQEAAALSAPCSSATLSAINDNGPQANAGSAWKLAKFGTAKIGPGRGAGSAALEMDGKHDGYFTVPPFTIGGDKLTVSGAVRIPPPPCARNSSAARAPNRNGCDFCCAVVCCTRADECHMFGVPPVHYDPSLTSTTCLAFLLCIVIPR